MPGGANDTTIAGGLTLANSTLEAFHHDPQENSGFTARTCFNCHGASNGNGVGNSHIFDRRPEICGDSPTPKGDRPLQTHTAGGFGSEWLILAFGGLACRKVRLALWTAGPEDEKQID